MNANTESRLSRPFRTLFACALVAALACGAFALSGCAQSTSSESSDTSMDMTAQTAQESAAESSAEASSANSASADASQESTAASSSAERAASQTTESVNSEHAIVFTVEASGYSSSDGKIPVAMTGTTASGTTVDTTAYIDCNGEGLSLAAGTYTVTVIESPLCADGLFFEPPTDNFTVKVKSSLASGESVQVSTPMKFTKVDPSTVSSSAIETAYRYAISGGLSKSVAKQYRKELQGA